MPPHHIDLTYLERLYKGDRSRVEHWIRLYLEEAPALFAQLNGCVDEDDAARLIAAAHDLRPQAHYLGSSALLERLIVIGDRARSDGASACKELVNEVLALGDVVALELRAVIASHADKKPV